MPIKAGNIIIGNQKVVVTTTTEKPLDAPAPRTVQRPAPNPEPIAEKADSDPVLIVNGKQKKVSKRSAYLLDMLTLDDQ